MTLLSSVAYDTLSIIANPAREITPNSIDMYRKYGGASSFTL